MDVVKTVPPSQPGIQRFQGKYAERQRRVTTVEFIVDEAPFHLRRPIDLDLLPNSNRQLRLRVANKRSDLRQRIKAAGGQWDVERKLWNMRLRKPCGWD